MSLFPSDWMPDGAGWRGSVMPLAGDRYQLHDEDTRPTIEISLSDPQISL